MCDDISEKQSVGISIFVYGSLRVGLYNFNRFNLDTCRSIRNVTLKGLYEMYTFDGLSYPFLTSSETFNSIEGDIIFIDDISVFNSIERMELGAGYERKTAVINDINVCFWVSNRKGSQFYKEIYVPNNNWLQYVNLNNNVMKRKKLIQDWEILRTSEKTKTINDWIIKTKSTNTVQEVYSLLDSIKIERKLPPRDAKGRFIKVNC